MFTLRNLTIAILLSLPFTKSATLPVGFALKIYEILIPLALAAAFREGRVDTGENSRFLRVWYLFFFLSLFPTAWGYTLIQQAENTALEWAVGRYDPLTNALFHTVYLALNIAGLAVFLVALQRRALSSEEFTRWWTWGALAAVGYSLVANLARAVGLPDAVVLRFSEPQLASIAGREFVRSGPFEEGNYFGLYLIVSLVIALWGGSRSGRRFYYWAMPALALGVFISASPAALVLMTLILTVAVLRPSTPRAMKLALAAVVGTVVLAVARTNLLEELVLDKFSLILFGGITDAGNISLMQRINESYHAWRLFLDHPQGVGIGAFGYFWGDHAEFFTELEVPYNSVKQIPNMVYMEVLAEQGIQGLVLFGYAMITLAVPLVWRREWLLSLGLASMLVYFVVFPSFRLVFIWAFWAFLLAVPTGRGRDGAAA